MSWRSPPTCPLAMRAACPALHRVRLRPAAGLLRHRARRGPRESTCRRLTHAAAEKQPPPSSLVGRQVLSLPPQLPSLPPLPPPPPRRGTPKAWSVDDARPCSERTSLRRGARARRVGHVREGMSAGSPLPRSPGCASRVSRDPVRRVRSCGSMRPQAAAASMHPQSKPSVRTRCWPWHAQGLHACAPAAAAAGRACPGCRRHSSHPGCGKWHSWGWGRLVVGAAAYEDSCSPGSCTGRQRQRACAPASRMHACPGAACGAARGCT